MNPDKNITVSYDPEADVLSIEGNRATPIDHASELGSLIVHFGKQDEPVLIEVLDASRTLKGQTKPFEQLARAGV